jgi:ADP-sugar diphosphatase
MGVLQADMDRCMEELRFLGMNAGGDGVLARQTPYTMLDYVSGRIPVHFQLHEDEDKWEYIKEHAAFKGWIEKTSRVFRLTDIIIQGVDMFNPVKLGFIKFKASVTRRDNGVSLPGVVFLRGGSVGIIVVLECEETGQKYTLLTKQGRVPIGQELLEIPAGMLDGSGNFGGTAAKELKEETGISISTGDLVNLSDKICSGDPATPGGIYLSPGGCDEFMVLYAYTKKMPLSEIDKLHGKLTGELNEGESIRLVIKRLEELPRIVPDAKSLVAYMLYMQQCDPDRPEFDRSFLLKLRLLARTWANVGRNGITTDLRVISEGLLERDAALKRRVLAAKVIAGLTEDELAILKKWAISPLM